MLITTLKRIIKTGFLNFCRNSTVSVSAVFVMTATLTAVIFLLLSNVLLDSALMQIKNKIDVNVYTTTEASPDEVFTLKDSLELLPEVENVEYVSREQVLVNFEERHRNDNLTLQALEELENNPFGAVLNIKAKDISQYSGIANYLDSEVLLSVDESTSIIEKVNYYDNKASIDKLNKIINAVENFGSAITILLVIISILIVFNTIRLTIYISKKEIEVMRLVGAKNNFIRGPFVFEGIIYGIFSALITVILFYPILFWVNPFIEQMFFVDLLAYYTSHIVIIFGIVLGVGVVLGIVSSFLAVRAYLKI